MADAEKHDIAWVLETRGHLMPNDLRDDLGSFTTVPPVQLGRLRSFIMTRRLPTGLTDNERTAYHRWTQLKVGAKELPPATLRLFDR